MMTKVNLNLVLVLTVASVILIPIAYGLVEPSIIINMEPSQTTKPLQIKDNLGTEVFSVDVDGTIFPQPSGQGVVANSLTGNLILLSVVNPNEFSIGQTPSGDSADFVQLHTWKIDYNRQINIVTGGVPTGLFHLPNVFPMYAEIGGLIKSDNVGDIYTISVFHNARDNTDASEWNQVIDDDPISGFELLIETNSLTFVTKQQRLGGAFNDQSTGAVMKNFCGNNINSTNPCFISIRAGSSSSPSGTNGTVDQFNFQMLILLPDGATITKVI